MSRERVLVAGFGHETNTFATELPMTDRAAFQQRREYFGDEIPERLRNTNTSVGGFVEVADELGVELVYTVAATANPGYFVTSDAYEFYTDHILSILRDHHETIDGVALSLHGAMVTENETDGEGPLLSAVRDVVGPDVPIVATLDLHGNVTDEMVAASDALVVYETYPHVDIRDTGRNGLRLLVRTLRGEVTPTMHVERPPVLASAPRQYTGDGPMAAVMARARELETRPNVLKVNVLPGFYPADVPAMGFSTPVVTDDDPAAAREVARDIASFVWERRDAFVSDFPAPDAAVREAIDAVERGESEDGPVVLADVGDNPGGGGSADGTTVLRALFEQGVTNAGFAIVRDPEAVETCIAAGVGERVTVTVGGKTDDRVGDPIIDVDGYVKAVTDGTFVNTGPMSTGVERHLGRTVLLRCGRDDGVSLVLSENRVQPMDLELWRHVGVQPERLDVVVVKSTNHYRAAYEPIASYLVPVNSPGLFPADPRQLEFERVRCPQYPLDEMTTDVYPDW